MIGVELGVNELRAGLVENGRVVRSAHRASGSRPKEAVDAIVQTVAEVAGRPESVGVAIPGQVDSKGRCWRLTNVPGFEGARLGEELATRLRCPVAVENDGTTAALGERLFGHGRTHASFLMVTLGAGIGGGLVLGHQLYPGASGFAGEIGHIRIDPSPSAWACLCGLHGCLEAYAGEKGVLRRFHELGGQARDYTSVEAAALRGDRAGVKVFEAVGRDLGQALAILQSILDLNAIVFSGRSAECCRLMLPSARETLEQLAYTSALARVPLFVSELGADAVLLGAAYLTGIGVAEATGA